ncbi:MAG: hypothetical protein KatS3mg114_1189 [Planctomycetaceae bacterium]|nr:MAG: hypothetical protein KatS3mg114_1189 [Planctomycetaceae bacterium]
MGSMLLELPTIQHWSCHQCAGCCRQHIIEITEEEKQRIESQGWKAADGVPDDRPLVVWFAGPIWRKRYRLAHRDDGACVFLDERGLCRIHGKFGEVAKPLACRLYPYSFHPHGKKVAISLRFSCPSVVANRGEPVTQQEATLRALAACVVPEQSQRILPPPVVGKQRVAWELFDLLLSPCDQWLKSERHPLLLRLARCLGYAHMLSQTNLHGVTWHQAQGFVETLQQYVETELNQIPTLPPPSATARMYFRLQVAPLIRRDTFAREQRGFLHRWRSLLTIVRLTRGRGIIWPFVSGLQPVSCELLEQPVGPWPDSIPPLFTRYLRIKFAGMHFCGRAFYDWSLVDGLQALVLMVPAVCWLARWYARSAGRDYYQETDFLQALALADHHYGYHPALGRYDSLFRLRWLAEQGELLRVVNWYTQ